jgi:hypothetical protein
MEDQDATDLRGRVSGALDTVSALLGLPAATPNQFISEKAFTWQDMLPRARHGPGSGTWLSR